MANEVRMVRCESCWGRGYRGGGRLPACRVCGGRGEVDLNRYKRIPAAYRKAVAESDYDDSYDTTD